MDAEVMIIIGVIALAGIGIMAFLLGVPFGDKLGSRTATHARMQRIVAAQRRAGSVSPEGLAQDPGRVAEEAKVERVISSKLTLEKSLRFACWDIPPLAFRIGEIVISVIAFYLVSLKCNRVMSSMALLTGPLFMRWLVSSFMERRFKAFDSDYPSFLMSLVSLLKTGMNTMTALEAGAQGLEDGSLVKEEVKLMLERLRYGVSEEKSIGSFGEDVYHPEIELFVQALLLSRRVGGNLADTLDRLAKQVRKRQYFRSSAVAAVGLQRGSIYFILGIMATMIVYLYFVYPQAVVGAVKDPFGWQVWQFSIAVILLGLFWVRQVTKIRV